MIEHYFLEEDWKIFESTDLAAAPKLRTMSKRCALLGILCPGEKVLKRSVAILECVDPDVANKDQQVKRQMMHDLRAHLKAEDMRDSFPFAHIKVYPDDPKDLPDEVLQHAYGDQRPVRRNMQLADLDARFAASAYRSSHKTLRRTGSELARTASARELPKAELSGGIDANALLSGLGQVMQMIMGGGKGAGPAEPTIQLLGAGAAPGVSPGSSGGAVALTPPPKAVSAPGETPALPDASKLALKPPCLSKPRNPEPEDPLAACEERLRDIANKAASAGRTDSGRAKKARKATAAAAALAEDEGDDEEEGHHEHAAAAKPTKGKGKTGAGVMKRPAAATPTTGKGKPGAGKKSAREKACQKAYDKAVKALGKDAPKEARAWAGKNAYRKRGEQFDRDGC